MRTTPAGQGGLTGDARREPFFVVQISWDDADSDYSYLTSNNEAQLPTSSPAVDSISDVVLDISGQTQKLNPDTSVSTIGSVRITLLDRTDTSSPPSQLITDKINTKLAAGDGLRGKIVRVYVGYRGLPFTAYDLRLTYIVDSISYQDGIYTMNLADLQRQERRKIFTPDETNLANPLLADDSIIQITSSDSTLFQLVERGGETTNFPTQQMSFIKIEDEVIAIDSQPQFDTTNGWHVNIMQRGALGTRKVDHGVDINEATTDKRKPRITEHIYLEGAAAKVIYALLCGVLCHGDNAAADDPYDLSTWSVQAVSPQLTAVQSAEAFPTGGKGKTYDLTSSNTSWMFTTMTAAEGYSHGNTCTVSILIKKYTASPMQTCRLQLNFLGSGTSASSVTFNPDGTGTPSTTSTAVTITDWSVTDLGNNWLHIKLSAYSTVGGASTTSARGYFFPSTTVTSQTITAAIGGLHRGDVLGWTVLPEHWHTGIDPDNVRLSDFQAIGRDQWNRLNDTGYLARIENPEAQDGKRYIEKEILLWMGAYMPVYSTGELGIKRLSRILSNSGYVLELNKENIVRYGTLKHDMRAVINNIRVQWNWNDRTEKFTKESVFIDATSVTKHGKADEKIFKFKTVHTGVHTDENILAHFDTLRDRYSGPPLTLSMELLPSMHLLEVGDTVKVKLDQIRDLNTGDTLDRTFEIQQITTNWATGGLKLELFASSQAAGELDRTTLNTVLEDAYYTSEGTSLDSSDSPAGPLTIVAGAVTANGTVTGGADMNDAGSIYYYDGDLTINAGITVTIQDNVQLRIKGTLTINGAIDGLGQGPAGGAATSLFDNATATADWGYASISGDIILTNPLELQDIDFGENGWFGIVVAGGSFDLGGGAQPPAYNVGTIISPVIDLNGQYTLSGYWPTVDLPKKGSISTLPWFNISNPNGYTLDNIPDDLRGHGGPGGLAFTTSYFDLSIATGTRVIRGAGGAGGDGGAGLCIICRGLAFGGSGEVDLSGGNAGNPGSYTIGGAKTFYGGHGAPGAPGALLVLMDGDQTNPDIDSTNFIANVGSVGSVSSGTDEISIDDYLNVAKFPAAFGPDVVNWPYSSAVFNVGSVAAVQDLNMTDTAHRIQYLPEPERPADDFGPGGLERGKFNNLLRYQKSGSPTASDFYGIGVAITADGSRAAVSDASANYSLQILRNIKAVEVEQTINSASQGFYLGFDQDGARLFKAETAHSTSTGRIIIYSRSGTTWSTEQTLTAGGSAPGTSEQFGKWCSWDKTATHLVTRRFLANFEIEYWSRSGTTWTFQEIINPPASVSANYASGVNISGDGNWLAIADYGLNGGTVHLYQRTGGSPYQWELIDSITVPDADTTSPAIAYQMGYGTSTTNSGVLINYDGTAIIANGNYLSDGWLHVIERQGDKLKYIGRYQNTTTWQLVGINDNGLLAITYFSSANGPFQLWRRESTSEMFKLDHRFDQSDGFTIGSAAQLSATGQFFINGTATADLNATDAGLMEAWEYYPEAD